MDVLIQMLREELARSKRLESKYLVAIRGLPKGSFFVRAVRGRRYGYLTFRKDGKVAQKYLGAIDVSQADRFRRSVEKRKDYRKKVKKVRGHIRILKRALRGKELSPHR